MDPNNDIIPESGALALSDAEWTAVRRRAEVIEPLARLEAVPLAMATAAGRSLGVSPRTVYTWIKRWRESGESVLALASARSDGGKGRTRLAASMEQLISSMIADVYLTKQRVSIPSLIRRIRAECKKAGFRIPAGNTIRARIERLNPEQVVFHVTPGRTRLRLCVRAAQG